MLPLRKVLQGVEKGLESLLQKTKEMEKMLDTIETVFTAEKPKAKRRAKPSRKRVAKKASKKKQRKVSATQAVLDAIERSKEGITTKQLKKETGLTDKQIWNIINRVKKEGKIKSEKRGSYVKV